MDQENFREVSIEFDTGWAICLQYRYFDKPATMAYQFVSRDSDGAYSRKVAGIPSTAIALELIGQAMAEGWGHHLAWADERYKDISSKDLEVVLLHAKHLHEVSYTDNSSGYSFCLRCSKWEDDTTGYRFLWRNSEGHVKPNRGQALIPSLSLALKLIGRSVEERLGDRYDPRALDTMNFDGEEEDID